MSLFDRLLSQLKQRGLEVAPAPGKPGMLVLRGPDKEKSPEIVKAVKAFRAQFLEKFGAAEPAAPKAAAKQAEPEPERRSCRQCGRDVHDPEDRERLAGINPSCREAGCPFRKRQ